MANRRFTPVSNPFVRACAIGDLTRVMALHAQGEDVNQVDRGVVDPDYPDIGSWDGHEPNTLGGSGLAAAMVAGHAGVVRYLLAAGADPHAANGLAGGITALERGIIEGFVEGVRIVHEEFGFALQSRTGEQNDLVLLCGHAAMAAYLQGCGLDMAYTNDHGRSLFSDACTGLEPNVPLVEFCYRAGFTANVVFDVRPVYTLSFAPEARETIESMSGGAGAFAAMMAQIEHFSRRSTPLNIAVYKRWYDVAACHLQNGANPYLRDTARYTAFDVLAMDGNFDGDNDHMTRQMRALLYRSVSVAGKPAPSF